jgi:hypothetical protein
MGLEAALDGTTAVPATEMTSSVAGAAPATAVTAAPTGLLCFRRRLAARSRPPTPEGSRPGFPWGDIATPIRPITGRPSLAPSSSTRNPLGWPCDQPTPTMGEATGLPRSADATERVRSYLSAGGASSAAGER